MLLERGSLSRTTGSTLMNAHSSRSHAIFTVLLEQRIGPEGEAPVSDEKVKVSRTNAACFFGQTRRVLRANAAYFAGKRGVFFRFPGCASERASEQRGVARAFPFLLLNELRVVVRLGRRFCSHHPCRHPAHFRCSCALSSDLPPRLSPRVWWLRLGGI